MGRGAGCTGNCPCQLDLGARGLYGKHPTGPPPLPPKPSTLPPKPPPLSSKPTKISPQPPELTPKPHNLTAYSPKITHKPTEFTPEHIPQPAEPTPKPSTRMFNNQEHAATILQGVEHFRSDEALCDVILESGDGSETFPVHRIIMASASEYFRDMFTSESSAASHSP
ncbi:hypothetical protein JZ751_029171 [Albula glossodonta]|uniref:BTB domain-containing protein n=1 Tax=Albula glossodonta TaxID=121402 RepID=A0A8T2P8C2_9TELE|nr:hypothetical protein JZ751_029171 [Albula glossodonta]